MRAEGAKVGAGLAFGALVGLLVHVLDLPVLVSYWHDQQYIVLAAAGLGAVLALTRLRPLLYLAAAGLGALWLAVCFTPLCEGIVRGLVRHDPVRPADAVFVFGSRIQPDDDPKPEAASRLIQALTLIAQGQAPRLILSELLPPSGRYAPIARAWMAAFRVTGELLTVGPVRNTRDEALAVAALCRARGFVRVLVVTSPTHTRRACAALEREGVEVVCVPAMETQFDLESLAHPGDRLRAFGPALHERAGLWLYRRRGWIR